MEIAPLWRDDDAVSSVVSVVLMIAVTIVLAAAIGTFVLGIGTEVTQTYPDTVFQTTSYPAASPDGYVTVEITGGSPVEAAALTVTIGGTDVWRAGTCDPEGTGDYTCPTDEWDGRLSSGATLRIEETTSSALTEGEELLVTWTKGGDSAILAERTL